MTNKSDDPRFEKGRVISAKALNRIMDGIRRVTASSPLTVRSASGGIALGSNIHGRRPAPERQIVRLTEDIGEGVYAWEKENGNGPGAGEATELSELEGISIDTKVIIYKHEGKWWFQVASPGAIPCKVTSKVSLHNYNVIQVDPPDSTTVKEGAEAFTAKEINQSTAVENTTKVWVFPVGGEFYFMHSVVDC